ncbi:MAG: lipopolysaccharide assembly protein LapA domain-containing protein [Prolixibacteraceae bacterium]
MHAVIIILLILAILLVIFTLQNSFEISISVFFWEINDAPFVLVLLSCVLVGYIIAAVYFTPRVWNLKHEKKELAKQNRELKELNEMKQKETEANVTHPEGIEMDEEEEEKDGTFFKE